MANNSWTIPIADLIRIAGSEADRVVAQAVHNMFNQVTLMSPVGDPSKWKGSAPKGYVGGRFRSNWTVSFDEPNPETTDAVNFSRSDAEVAKALTFRLGCRIWLTNNLPYAERLEYGWSQQAPSGMVRLNALLFRRYIAQASSGAPA